jgi:hypothetical protein
MKHLDIQMRAWSKRLISDLAINEEESQKLATTIASEVRWLPMEAKDKIINASPVDIKYRYEELLAFQGFPRLYGYCAQIRKTPIHCKGTGYRSKLHLFCIPQ